MSLNNKLNEDAKPICPECEKVIRVSGGEPLEIAMAPYIGRDRFARHLDCVQDLPPLLSGRNA
jgi:hypothetical protein